MYLLTQDALPHYEAHGTRVKTIAVDNGRELRSRPDHTLKTVPPAPEVIESLVTIGALAAEQRFCRTTESALRDKDLQAKAEKVVQILRF